MNAHSHRFPIRPQANTIWIARNPENQNDASWFKSEADMLEHMADYGEDYIYLELNEADETCRFVARPSPRLTAEDHAEARADYHRRLRIEGAA